MTDYVPDTEVARRTQARILDAASEEIERVGYKKLRMEAVARGSGITRQTIYNYFPSKTQLVVALLAREGLNVNLAAKARIDPALTGESLLSTAIIVLIDAARENRLFSALSREGAPEYINDLAEHSAVLGSVMHEFWAVVLGRLRDEGLLRTDVPLERLEWWLSHVYRSMLWRPAAELDNRPEMDLLVRAFIVPSVIVR